MATSTSMTVSGAGDEARRRGNDEGDERSLPSQQPQPPPPPTGKPAAAGRGGFFTIHKPSQGRTTRLATGGAAALLIGLTVHFLLTQVPAWFFPGDGSGSANTTRTVWNVIVIALAVVGSALAWRLLNKPDNAEFLIATDSEMKKVNWTSRKQLWGSTKVVIFFMLAIAGLLFVVDLVFHWLFFLIDVLKFKPLGS
jgi:preprotein translocase subunit SecE